MSLKTDLKSLTVPWNGRAIFALVLASAITLAPATAGTITGLFNTGVDNGGVVLANGIDSHYVLTVNPNNGSPNAFVVTNGQFPFPPWIPDDASCKWIGPTENQGNFNAEPAAGIYDYRLTVVTSGSFVINGMWASDDTGTIVVVGGGGGGTVISGSPNSGPTGFTPFSISLLTSGTNTLDFIVNNQGSRPSPTGLRVAFASATMTPEPGTMMPGAFGLLAVGLLRRRT